jgi:dTDP-4-amino-4,6-dideoxygalactose transaminase
MKRRINLFEPSITSQEINSVTKILKSKFWASGSGIGKVKEFENTFTKFIGCKDTIAVNSGTAALHLAVSTLKISKRDILVPTITFASTAHAAVYNGAKPVFVDVDEDTLNIDLQDLEKKITKNTKAVIAVHFGGYPVNLKKLQKICNDHKLTLIEDAAHACGSHYDGKRIGTHSDLVCFSFHPVKNLASLSGGAIALNGTTINKKILNSRRWCGLSDRSGSLYDIKDLGWNYYMNEISAGIALVQLKRLNSLNKIRKNTAKKYFNRINLKKMPFSENSCYHLYWIRVKNRSLFMKNMSEAGIETGIHYKPLHLMNYYKSSKIQLKKSESIWNELVTIPMHANLTDEDVEKIISNVNKYAK